MAGFYVAANQRVGAIRSFVMMVMLAQIDWNTLLQKPDMLPLLVLVPTMGMVALVAIIVPQWRKVRQTDAAAALKSQMIQRGFSADEIIRVIEAGDPSGRKKRGSHDPCGVAPCGC